MMALSEIIARFEADYRQQYSTTMLPSHRHALAAMKACEAVMRPGHTAGDVFDAHARVMDEHGMEIGLD